MDQMLEISQTFLSPIFHFYNLKHILADFSIIERKKKIKIDLCLLASYGSMG